MKFPKEINRYCPFCKKHTLQVVSTQKQRSRSSTHPNSRGSDSRIKSRSLHGYGNWGKRSRKGPKDWKKKTKITKKITVQYTCKACKKTKFINSAIRSSRIEIGDKISK